MIGPDGRLVWPLRPPNGIVENARDGVGMLPTLRISVPTFHNCGSVVAGIRVQGEGKDATTCIEITADGDVAEAAGNYHGLAFRSQWGTSEIYVTGEEERHALADALAWLVAQLRGVR